MAAISMQTPPPHALTTPDFSPQSRSLPSKSDSNSHGISVLLRSGSWNSADGLSQPKPHTLKRKAGSPNLNAARWSQKPSRFGPLPRQTAVDAEKKDEWESGWPFTSSQTRPSNIHSFAFDFGRYLDPLPPTSNAKPLDARVAATDANRPLQPKIRPHKSAITGYPAQQGPSQDIGRAVPRGFQKPTSTSRSVPAGSILSSDASTTSLSRFPLPPASSNPTDPYSSEPRDEPQTPTVYHFRGASFEFVNPRSSLRLQNIGTPAEQDDRQEYFQLSPTVKTSRGRAPTQAQIPIMADPPRIADISKPSSRSTPPRSLFDDLPSAYNSIRKNQKTLAPILDLPLPPSPMPSRTELKPRLGHFASTENLLERGYISQLQRQSPASSFRQRFSQVFRPKGRDVTESDEYQELGAASQAVPGDGNGPNQQHIADETSFELDSDDEFEARHHYYDDASILNDTNAGSHQTSFIFPPRSSAKDSTTYSSGVGQNESTEDLIASYGNDFNNNDTSHLPTNPPRHQSMPLLRRIPSAHTLSRQADSTIGEILEQYHNLDQPSPARTDARGDHASRRVSMSAFDANVVRPTSEEMGRFDFGLAQQQEQKHQQKENRAYFGVSLDKGVRSATARALSTHATAAPLVPLPADPPDRVGSRAATREYSGNSSNLSATSYGDTRHLLLISQPSIEMGRGIGANQVDLDDQQLEPHPTSQLYPSQGHLAPMSESARRNSPANDDSRRTSERSYEDIVNRDIKYLSRLSGISDFQGSVYMVGSTGSAQARDNEKYKKTKRDATLPRAQGRMHQLNSPPPVEATCLPIAAFQQSSVVPGICRLPTAERRVFAQDQGHEKGIDKAENESEIESVGVFNDEASDDTFDWETLPESRTAHGSQQTSDSFAEWSSYASLHTFRNLNLHPGDNRLQHGYKLHAPDNSHAPVLVPTYEFRGGGPGFPDRNALTPPTPALYNTYKHPVPLSQTHENPFTSSPPQIAGSGGAKTPVFSAKPHAIGVSSSKKDENLPLFHVGYHNLSLSPERTGDASNSKSSTGLLNGAKNSGDLANGIRGLNRDSSGWLSSDLGPEASLEAEHGSPSDLGKQRHRQRSARLSSGVDAGLVHVLRQGDPRMASSPLSPSNSFAKLSRLGPMANITGTPNGTGMREVGSSLIGSSSPAALPSTSPPAAHYHTPITEPSTGRHSTANASPFQASSPLARFEDFQYGFRDLSAASKHRRGPSFRDALVADGHAERQSRRAVPGQKKLIEMTLSPNDLRESWNQRNPSGKQLLPLPVTSASLPKLRQRYRSPSSHTSGTRERKRLISWVCFALCAIFPFTLILYGHGILDAVMVYWTNGDIRHFGRLQKNVAKITGWGAAVMTILTVVILFAVIRTVPNDYSR